MKSASYLLFIAVIMLLCSGCAVKMNCLITEQFRGQSKSWKGFRNLPFFVNTLSSLSGELRMTGRRELLYMFSKFPSFNHGVHFCEENN
ncbi:MAG: hypothetical protein RBQ87_01225 [Candidatus Cloacimonadaceae bacterium]|jgi:hypothetical protein|nr:hypothetical protein [Candidatus Cloacimonadaceae bacterium]